MKLDAAQFGNTGMSQDVSISKSENKLVFENRNIRITAINDNTTLSITNERGPGELATDIEILGKYLAHCIVGKSIVLFTHGAALDCIYLIDFSDIESTLFTKLLFSGDLNFTENSIVDTIAYYESEDCQKVYFTSAETPLRVINIKGTIDPVNNTQFDFTPTISEFPSIEVEKIYNGTGKFSSGTVQYLVSYYRKFGAETKILNTSTIQYITSSTKGLDNNETSDVSFKITINNIDTSFDYLRVYSVQRNTLNGSLVFSLVSDIKINSNTATIVDTNINIATLDSNLLYFIGGNDFCATTITQKDNTLFAGGITYNSNELPESLVEELKTWVSSGTFKECLPLVQSYRSIGEEFIPGNYYQPFNVINEKTPLQTFKSGETYRFAIQFQDNKGQWTTPVFIGDKKITYYPILAEKNTDSQYKNYKVPTLVFNNDYFYTTGEHTTLKECFSKYTNYRLLMAETSSLTRSIVAQGIVSPTIFNYSQRSSNAPYAISSPLFRDNTQMKDFYCLNGKEIRGTESTPYITTPEEVAKNITIGVLSFVFTEDNICKELRVGILGYLKDGTQIILDAESIISDTNVECVDNINNFFNKYQLSDFNIDLADFDKYLTAGTTIPNWEKSLISILAEDCPTLQISTDQTPSNALFTKYLDNTRKTDFYVDSSIVTFHSPDISSIQDEDSLKFRLVGVAPITANKSDIDITISNKVSPNAKINNAITSLYNKVNLSEEVTTLNKDLLYTDYSWIKSKDYWYLSTNLVDYPIYMWDKEGSIIGQNSSARRNSKLDKWGDSEVAAAIDNKIIGNRRYSYNTEYFTPENIDISRVQKFDSQELEVKKISLLNKDIYYYGNYDYLATFTTPYTVASFANNKLTSYDPIKIRYKSTPHLVFGMYQSGVNQEYLYRLPVLHGEENYSSLTNKTCAWLSLFDNVKYSEDTLIIQKNTIEYPYIYIGELYRDLPNEALYGGYSEENLEKLKWIPCSISKKIGNSVTTYGDTFYQRYDCLKTYPYSDKETNSIVEVLSVMLESYNNIALRSDSYKENITTIRPSNFNLYNTTYSQLDNIFTYNIVDDKLEQSNYKNEIIWSLPKTPNEDIDTWTAINPTSSLNLDGNKGDITKLLTYNDKIFSFQEKGISLISYNDKTALANNNGAPIEIVNSGLVNGYAYIMDNVGLSDMRQLVKGQSGIYFIDALNKDVFIINNDGILNLKSKGMSQWFKNNINKDGVIKLYYDSLTNDVYFINNSECLLYNEILTQFTSFMPYSGISSLFSINGNSIILCPHKDRFSLETLFVYKMFAGEYNKGLDLNYFPYSITYKVNPSNTTDNVFTNVEFFADILPSTYKIDSVPASQNIIKEVPFDTIKVWNEFQYGEKTLDLKDVDPASIKQKFRKWRIQIPRDQYSKYKLDRIRNPWCYIKVEKAPNNTNKFIMHDFIIKYYK